MPQAAEERPGSEAGAGARETWPLSEGPCRGGGVRGKGPAGDTAMTPPLHVPFLLMQHGPVDLDQPLACGQCPRGWTCAQGPDSWSRARYF